MMLRLDSGDHTQVQVVHMENATPVVASHLKVYYLGQFLSRNFAAIPFPMLPYGSTFVVDNAPLEHDRIRNALQKDGTKLDRGCLVAVTYFDSLVVSSLAL